MSSKRILFVTDSLGLPRSYPEMINIDSTWPYIMSSKISTTYSDAIFYYYCIYGLTTDMIVEYLETLLYSYQPDVLFFQVGIVDCYPRALKKSELAILKRIPVFNKVSHSLVKKYYNQIVEYRNISYVSSEKFKANCNIIRSKFIGKQLIILPIAPSSDYFSLKNNKVADKINEYNTILKSIFQTSFIEDLYQTVDHKDLFLSDGYHLSEKGNNHIGNFLFDKCFVV